MKLFALVAGLLAGVAAAQTVNIPVQVTVTPTTVTVNVASQSTVIPVPMAPPPTCTSPQPASTTATIACPTGQTGSWTQTTSYTAAAYPACWTPLVAPTSAPAGSCVTPPPPPPPPVLTTTCTATSGPLILNASATRPAGISPFLDFFDATSTTDTAIKANMTAFQDVTYTWNFGDSGASGTSNWAYGSNPGKNSMNSATGGIAAHAYLASADTTYTATVTASDGTNKASCQVAVTAYSPSGANGFAGTRTTCQAATTTPVAGVGGCPVGASVLMAATQSAAIGASMAGKRVLFRCGDTFTGSSLIAGVGWRVGAYGTCPGTQAGRPIMTGTMNVHEQATGDGAIADLDFETGSSAAVLSNDNYNYIPYQVTLINLLGNGNNTNFYTAQGAQWGYIQLVQNQMGTQQGTFINYAENNQSQWGTNSLYNNINYQAVLGSHFNGVGAPNSSAGIETFRVSACRLCVFENNDFENANDVGAVFKLHNGNTKNSSPTWTGVYTELIEISDNLFAGTSGAELIDIAAQNPVTDERLRNIIFERNLKSSASSNQQLLISGQNMTVRDNVFYQSGGGPAAQFCTRGSFPYPTQYVEVYNNSSFNGSFSFGGGGPCGGPGGTASFAQNNLCYTGSCVSAGTGNTVSNNTATVSNNPGWTNGSGKFSVISDFKPTVNYAGGISVPVLTDALGTAWSPTWSLGAVHP